MQNITNNYKQHYGSFSEFLSSIAIMILSLIVFTIISVFIDARKTYEVLSIALIYLTGIAYLFNKHPIDFAKELHKPLLVKYTLIGLLIGIGVLALSFAKFYFLPEYRHASNIVIKNNSDSLFVMGTYLVAACIIIPVCEEVLFRYYFYNILKIRFGLTFGVILSTLLFASVHYYNPEPLAIVFQGLLYTYVYEKSESIWSGIILHSINNSIWSIISYI